MNPASNQPAAFGVAPADARLPSATRVGGVRLQVSDLERSLAYYRDVIGLRVIDRSDDTATLGVPASDEPLVTLRAVPGTRPTRRRGAFGLFHFAILLPDREALGRFVSHLALGSGPFRDGGPRGQRGDLPLGPGWPRDRGLRRPAAERLAEPAPASS